MNPVTVVQLRKLNILVVSNLLESFLWKQERYNVKLSVPTVSKDNYV
jgi:hypothetical protein